jgi:class 3 adenylate cyclase
MVRYQKLNSIYLVIVAVMLLPVISRAQAEGPSERPFLSSVEIDGGRVIRAEEGAESVLTGKDYVLVVRNRENNLVFGCQPSENISYRFSLEGFDRTAPLWQERNYREYTNLPSGKYNLQISYRLPGGESGQVDPLSIRILPVWYKSFPAVIFYIILPLILAWVLYNVLELRFAERVYMLEQIINKRTEDLIIEKEKSEALLENVLPKNTADEIILTGKAEKIRYNFVTVLFSDIQGFTRIAEEMNPEVLIDELDRFFFHFDSVVEKYHIEKIKTIGDAYMCAGGIPEKNRTNPVEVVLAALEVQDYMKKLKESNEVSGMKFWDIRIGIHTGSVVAGVIGHKKLSYDIWGDTVNTASRMESSGVGGKINISGTTYEFVRDFFICEHRGRMPVKYKGELDMYFVSGILPELTDENGLPNDAFRLKMQLIRLQDVEDHVFRMFDEEAPPDLYFHNASMVKGICSQADLLANAEQLGGEGYLSLRLAALFLFTGYISNYDDPAGASCMFASELLPLFGFSDRLIMSATDLITDSYIDVHESEAARILHDARYDYLGRVDFLNLSRRQFRERNENGQSIDWVTWRENQKQLLLKHDFLTGSARIMRNISAGEQISQLEKLNKEPI